MPTPLVINTPTDFGRTISATFSRSDWFEAPNVIEADIRHSLDEIFNDLPYIDTDDPALLSSYLESVDAPLRQLDALGLRIFAVLSTGLLQDESGRAPSTRVSHTNYVVAPPMAAFRAGSVVHLLAGNCKEAARAIMAGTTDSAWGSLAAVETALEGSVPWCGTCALRAISAP